MKIVLKIFATVLISLVLALVAVWYEPSLVVNSTTLGLVKNYLEKKGYSLSWKEAQLSAESLDFKTKKIILDLSEFYLRIPSGEFEGTFPVAKIEAQFELRNWKPSLYKLGPVQIRAQELKIIQKPASDAQEPATSDNELPMPTWLLELKPHSIDIAVESLLIQVPGFESQGNARVLANAIAQREKGYQYTVDFKDTAKRSLVGSLSVNEEHKGLGFSTNFQYKSIFHTAKLEAEGTLESQSLRTTLTLKTTNPSEGISAVDLKNCKGRWDLTSKGDTIDLDCGLFSKLGLPRVEDLPYTKLLRDVNGRIKAKVDRKMGNQGPHVTAKVDLSLDPLFSSLKEGTAQVSINAEGNQNEALSLWHYKVDSTLGSKNMKRITQFLAHTSWAVPEPFTDLDGSFEVHTLAEGNLNTDEIILPLEIKTSLASSRQKLDLLAQGKLTLGTAKSKASGLEAEVELQDIQLILPPLDPYTLPKPLPDSRIRRRPESIKEKREVKKEKPVPFDLNLSIRTLPEKPVRLVSSLSKNLIPVGLNIKLASDSAVTGSIDIKPFNLELFKRDARLESMHLVLKPNPDDNEIHGVIQVVYVDYTISILIDGLLSHPTVNFVSDPPLSDKQLIAVLLFGRSLDALDENETQSVGSTRNALADGAVGLASMYALASTPVESVGYNSFSKVFSAKIRLADKTSMTIGTDLKDVKTLGLKRRLGPHWDITTYLENPFLAANRSLSTFLEWNWRY